MKITIHRGTHQIGGCATEISTNKARIFIDFGSELDTENAAPFDIEGVTKGKSSCDGIFFTHYHGDHIGLLDTINKDIPLYMGKDSKAILTILNDRLAKSTRVQSHNVDVIENIKTFKAGQPVIIKDITVIPYYVDHSAFDAHMFLIEADGKKILYTGDFRGHGYKGKGLIPTLEKYIGKVDALVCEGTTLNRSESKQVAERELSNKIKTVLEENKYVFVVCSSTNIDRIAGIASVMPRGKYFLTDKYQKDIIDYIRKDSDATSGLYRIDKALYYAENLDAKIEKQGFCMLVRTGNPEHKKIMDRFKDKKAVVIYSMWKGYLAQERVKQFLDGFKRIDLHTSGHADKATIKAVIDVVNPQKLIPIHTEVPECFEDVKGNSELILLDDKVEYEI